MYGFGISCRDQCLLLSVVTSRASMPALVGVQNSFILNKIESYQDNGALGGQLRMILTRWTYKTKTHNQKDTR